MIDKKQLIQAIISILTPAPVSFASSSAITLLVLTAATESKGGTYIKQINGPACGIFQMEPFTCRDIEARAPGALHEWLVKMRGDYEHDYAMTYHLDYAIAVARVKYFMVREPLPTPDNIIGMALYWKKDWNTYEGAGKVDTAVDNYNLYIGKG